MADQRTITLGKVIEAATSTSPAYPSATIDAITPDTGAAAGGTEVEITGTSLSGTTAVLVDGANATGVTVNSDSSVTATTPAGNAGAVHVIVATPAGAVIEAGGFTYT